MQLRAKNISFFIADILAFYSALWIALYIRFAGSFSEYIFFLHLKPLTAVFGLWAGVFYIAGLYDLHTLSRGVAYQRIFATSLGVCTLLSVLVFYTVPYTTIAPKTILVLLMISFAVFDYVLRRALFGVYAKRQSLIGVVLAGKGRDTTELATYLAQNPQLGYRLIAHVDGEDEIFQSLSQESAHTAVVTTAFMKNQQFTARLYEMLLRGKAVVNFSDFYEEIFNKVSIDELQETWFLEEMRPHGVGYASVKRAIDIIASLFLLVCTILFWPIFMLLILLNSLKGSPWYADKRCGVLEKVFYLFKFRTMHPNGAAREKPQNGESFGLEKEKNRIFFIGALFRKLRIDELPQMINVLKGDMSFIGPRADSLEYYLYLKEQIPYYQIRTVALPGLTGWAQVNDKFGSSVEDARQRLAYDIYYMKNKSFAFDVMIMLKTLKTIFSFSGK